MAIYLKKTKNIMNKKCSQYNCIVLLAKVSIRDLAHTGIKSRPQNSHSTVLPNVNSNTNTRHLLFVMKPSIEKMRSRADRHRRLDIFLFS